MVVYEWSKEIIDEHGDVIDSHFGDKVKDLDNIDGELVLVRTEGDEINGVEDRFWAYVVDGKLPYFFQNGAGHEVCIKVPEKFKKELLR